MLTIEIETELEFALQKMTEHQHISINEIINRLLSISLKEKQESKLLIDIAKTLPTISCFKDKDPLEIQKALRDEWT